MSSRLRYSLLIAALLAVYYFMAVSAARTKNNTFDESIHITAGYNAWMLNDHRFDGGNGDFLKRWATLPLLFSKPNFPPLDTENWRNAEYVLFSRDFLFNAGNNPDAILAQTRAMVALLGVALGALIFACSRSLFGNAGGFISVVAFAFCPNMLAHGALVTTDLAMTLTLFATTWFLWRLLHIVSWPNLIGSLIGFSLLVISKMSAVIIVPIAGILIVARFFNRDPWLWQLGQAHALTTRGRQAVALLTLVLIHCLAGWLTIWTVFNFKYVARGDVANEQLTLPRPPEDAEVRGVISQLTDFCYRTHVLPESFVNGMEQLVGISKRRPSFVDGHWKAGGQTAFFPYAFLVKTTPALLALIAFGFAGWAYTRKRGALARVSDNTAAVSTHGPLYHAIPLFVLFIIYGAVAMKQGVNIGHRHLLPVYSAVYVLAGSAALMLPSRKRIVEVVIALLLGWHIADSIAVRPHYLAYFSSFVGGPEKGYQRLVDSSLDWGQDLRGFKRWLETNNPDGQTPVFFSYFGTGIPEYYGIETNRLPGFPDWRQMKAFACTPGYYVISATLFQNIYTQPFGPWNRVYEEEYQMALQRLGLTETNGRETRTLADILLQHPDAFWQEQFGIVEKLRFNRLCGWLRATGRAPDTQIGHSILIWKLDERDLHEALWAPPQELYDFPATHRPDGI